MLYTVQHAWLASIVDETVKDRYKIADPVGVGLGSAQSSRLSRIIFSLSTLQSQLCARQAGIY